MAATSSWYGPALSAVLGDLTIDGSTTLKAILLDNTYTPDVDHQYVSDLTGELTASGYARVSLSSVVASYDTATDTASFTADDIEFASMTATFRHLVICDDTGTDSTSRLVKYTDFGADQSVTAGTVTVNVDAAGLAKITAA